MLGKKSGKFDIKGIENLAKGKPVVYRIEDDKGKILYVGCRKKRERSSAPEGASARRRRSRAGRCASSNSTKGEYSGG